ncbi:Eukaryotic translation initiation factor 2-alpha kinase 3 [Mactra antiquata]
MGRTRKSRWNSCLMWFAASTCALCLTLSRSSASDGLETETVRPIEFGGNEVNRKFAFVSTLDGRLSALDIENDGQLLWSIAADTRPLLSSSISKLEIMHDGIPTRYIPSLDGELYRYDGASIEAVPLSADKLLSSTYKLAEDTMMIGGKDTVTYGIDPVTGEIRYACGMKGCRTFGEQIQNHEDVLVINRKTQTVRAVDSRTGSEKWNFSVGEHDVKFIKGQKQNIYEGNMEEDAEMDGVTCTNEGDSSFTTEDKMKLINSVKILVPDGMVVGVDPEDMHLVNWQHKFKSPVSNVWLMYEGELLKLDMFEHKNIPALSSFEFEEQPLHAPALYVGLHDKQLYVQSSVHMKRRMVEAEKKRRDDLPPGTCQNEQPPRVAWKPYLNTAQWRTPTMNNRVKQISDQSEVIDTCEDADHALTIWHENYPFDNGFYLYPEISVHVPLLEDSHSIPNDTVKPSSIYIYETVIDKVLMVWNWWKEVVGISVLVSTIVHMILARFHKKQPAISQQISSSQSTDSVSEQDIKQHDNSNPPSRQNSDDYISRFASDFEDLEVLGRGGFGVVFEAKNKVDECHYAIKRITLPNSEGAKDKVMREAKTLAKLDHIGIVRYFHAWIESPPPGWQEEKDQLLENGESMTSMTQYTKSPPSNIKNHSELSTINESSHLTDVKKNNPSPFDLLKNPFGESKFDFTEPVLNRGGSEEFSIHNVDESGWGIEDSSGQFFKHESKTNDLDDESGSFSCGMGAPTLHADLSDDSVEIEFCDSNHPHSDKNDNSSCENIPSHNKSVSNQGSDSVIQFDDTNDSLHIVFEDSGCADKSSKSSSGNVCIDILDGHSGSKKSSDTTTCTESNIVSSSLSQNSLNNVPESPPILFTLESHKDCSNNEKNTSSEHKPKLFLYIQMQLCKRETLKDWLSANTLNRDRHMVLDLFDQIVSAIEYVHDCGLMHRDLKPSNIFFSMDGVVKMGDFGLVTTLAEDQDVTSYGGNPYKKHTSQVGTQLYMSPEQTNGETYSQKVDIFSLGVILFELLYPFSTQMERVSTLIKVRKQIFPERFTREMPKEADFVKRLLSQAPDNRPSAKEILSSELLKEFEDRRMPRRFRIRTISQNSS